MEALVSLDICVVVRVSGAYRIFVKNLIVVDRGLRVNPGLHEVFML